MVFESRTGCLCFFDETLSKTVKNKMSKKLLGFKSLNEESIEEPIQEVRVIKAQVEMGGSKFLLDEELDFFFISPLGEPR